VPSHLDPVLERFFTESAPLAAGDRLAIAFSGGPDSLALLLAAERFARRRACATLAVHVDHRLDPGSAARARQAASLARQLGVRFVLTALAPESSAPGESREAAARRGRYRELERVRAAHGARWLATAHHAGDQAETVALRLAQGSTWAGLAGIRPLLGTLVRPLLGLPREALADEVAASGLAPVIDPTNRDLRLRRNAVRHRLLPHLTAPEPEITARLARLATAAAFAGAALDRRFQAAGLLPAPTLPALRALPPAVRRELLRRQAAATAPLAGRRESVFADLDRQLAAGGRIGCDAGGGWRWTSQAGRLVLVRPAAPTPGFSYTLLLPGSLRIREAGVRLRAVLRDGEEGSPARVSGWRARLDLVRAGSGPLEVRSRRAGDRMRPEGSPGRRKLKELLIDGRIPLSERDRLPLVCAGGELVWVPGVALAAGWRAGPGKPGWDLEVCEA